MPKTHLVIAAVLMSSGAVFGDAAFLTEPYLQNIKPGGITIMWELQTTRACVVEHGPGTGYGQSTVATSVSSGFGTRIYKCVLTGLAPSSTHHYRVVMDGADYSADRSFTTAPDAPVSFAFGIWGDSQATNNNRYPPDPYEPTNGMMRHMAGSGVSFAVGVGDMAEDGDQYGPTRLYYLDRVARHLGATVPWFVAWGNHDRTKSAVIRKFADMPSKERAGYTAGWGGYSFDYAGCHFICMDYDVMQEDLTWLLSDMQSAANLAARFTFLFIHVPPYAELWRDGDAALRAILVPLMEQNGVDACFSGHIHEYERGYQRGIHYCVTGGGSRLGFGNALTVNWPHITVGGHRDIPGYRRGLVNEYVRVEVTEDAWTATTHAFNFDGSFAGVIDRFGSGISQEDSDGDGLTDGDEQHVYGTDPAHADTDRDGLTDGEETDGLRGYKTNPLLADTDQDGLTDGREYLYGTNPLDPRSVRVLPVGGHAALTALFLALCAFGICLSRTRTRPVSP